MSKSDTATTTAICEGDVILISALKADNGFVLASPKSSRIHQFTIKEDVFNLPVIPNVHFMAFKILPEYADPSYNPFLPPGTKDGDGLLHRKLVYGCKIKLLLLVSNQYFSIPCSRTEVSPAVLSSYNDSCLFKILSSEKPRGDTVHHGDKFFLESVLQKGHYVFFVKNVLINHYELRLGENHSVFRIHLHTSTNVKVSSKAIRGGYAVMLCNSQINAYIGGQDSLLTEVLPSHKDIVSKVGARKKRDILTLRSLPVSGDCWWQLEKSNDPLNGEPIIYGEKYRLKHLLILKYLAVTDDMKMTLADSNRQDCTFDFVIRGSGNSSYHVMKEDVIKLEFTHDGNIYFISLEEKSWEWMTESAKKLKLGSKWFNLCPKDESDQKYLDCFKIVLIEPENLKLLYSIQTFSYVLGTFYQSYRTSECYFLELSETLKYMLKCMVYNNQRIQKMYAKMFRTNYVIDLLMGYLALPNVDRKISEAVCCVLKVFASVPSHRCHEYLAKDSFIQIFLDKLGTGIGVEAVLSKLVEDESAIAKTLVEKFMEKETMRSISSHLDAATLELLSTLCFVSGRPDRRLQGFIFDNIIRTNKYNFFHTEVIEEDVYYFKKNEQQNRKSLTELVSMKKDKDCEFFVAQLNLFSSVCKGINQNCIELIEKKISFEEASLVLTKLTVHPSIKSAYLKLVMSVYLDEDSSVDIDNIWHCYLWEKLSPTTPPCEASKLINIVKKNFIKKLEHQDKIIKITDTIIGDIKRQEKLCVQDCANENEFLYRMLSFMELLVNYGYWWNVDQESYFDLDILIDMLDGLTDIYSEDSKLNEKYTATERYKRNPENLVIFQIKLKIVKILILFFKQLKHLALERFMNDFNCRRTNSILSPEDLTNLPKTLLVDDITEHISTHPNYVVGFDQSKLQKCFSIFEYYRCFHVQEKKLVNILQDIMLYQDDELRIASVTLLFDIYSKEDIMFEQARKSYIVEGDRGIYDLMMNDVTFQEDTRYLKRLLQGQYNEDIAEKLVEISEAMIIDEDETEPATRTQNIAFTTGVFSSVLTCVLKFCESIEEGQVEVFSKACKCLQNICRENHKIQQAIFIHIEDLIRSSIHATSSVARLITEVLTNNTSLCQQLSQDIITKIYTLATTNADYPEYLEYFTTLEAIIKPWKSSSQVMKINQQIIARLFHDHYQELFDELLSKDYKDQRIKILEKSSDDDIQLLKLRYITNLLANCCEGHHKFAKSMCQDIFNLKELVEILTNPKIFDERKVPFAHLLYEIYPLNTTVCIYGLAADFMFWKHVDICSNRLAALTIQGDEERKHIKCYLRKVFKYHVSWNDIFHVNENLKKVCLFLLYVTKGIGPLIMSICIELSSYKTNTLVQNAYFQFVNGINECFRKFGNSLASLLSEGNEETFLNSENQSEFWKGCLNSIDNALLEPPQYEEFITCKFTEKYFVSEELEVYKNSKKSEQETNELFQHFINNYTIVYEWNATKTMNDEVKGFTELLPGGLSFLNLVQLFDDLEISFDEEQELQVHFKRIHSLLIMLRVLLHCMARRIPCKERCILNRILTMTLKVLIGIIHIRMEKPKCDMNEIECIQNELIRMKFHEHAMIYLPSANDDITVHVMSFLTVLILNNNKGAQNKLFDLIFEEKDFFIRIHKLVDKLLIKLSYAATLKNVVKRKDSQPNQLVEDDEELIELSFEDDEIDENVEDDDPALVDDDIVYVEEPGDNMISKRVGIVLELVSAMCDGQHQAMQHILRTQENHETSYNIVGEIAVLLQTLAEAPMVSNVPIIIKAIQALIEMCAGNYENQQVALGGQVIDSINIILKGKPKSTEEIKMQCKAIELFQILLEETDEKHATLLQAIFKDLKKGHVLNFIRNMYEHCENKDENYDDIIEESMYRAYHTLRVMLDHEDTDKYFYEYVGLSKSDMENKPWKLLHENTEYVEINYITKKKNEGLLVHVYFPYNSSEILTDDEKRILQNGINRDNLEDKVEDLLNWADSFWKKYKYKKHLKANSFKKAVFFGAYVRHLILIFLTVLLNVFVLGFFEIPQFASCSADNVTSEDITTPLILPRPSVCWSGYQYLLIYVFGVPHLILSIWMVLEYFLEEAPNFKFGIPFIQQFLYDLVQKNESWLNKKIYNYFEAPEESQCYDIYFFSVYPLYHILFMVFSILGLATYGYFYCFCLFYIFIKVDVSQFVIKAIVGKAKQLFFVALFILCLLMVYAVLSFAFMSSFFDLSESLYCRTLWECLITVVREGLLDSFGGKIPVTYGNSITNFNIYLWRSFFDLTYYILITTIALNVVTAIFVDRFSELRAERDETLKDQKEVCFICGISSDIFETRGYGFRNHYKYDHNIYSYIYYIMYIKSKPPKDHSAIEKYVYSMITDNRSIKFFPLRKASVLGGSTVATRDTKLILDLKKAIEQKLGNTVST